MREHQRVVHGGGVSSDSEREPELGASGEDGVDSEAGVARRVQRAKLQWAVLQALSSKKGVPKTLAEVASATGRLQFFAGYFGRDAHELLADVLVSSEGGGLVHRSRYSLSPMYSLDAQGAAAVQRGKAELLRLAELP